MCRQRARPYLFSNSVPPMIVGATLEVLDLIDRAGERRERLFENTRFWRQALTAAGFDVKPGESPIVPVMLYDARLAQEMARGLFEEGVYVVGFFFPVVPRGQARIRTQLSAAHDRRQLDTALRAFEKVGRKLGVLGRSRQELLALSGAGGES
jgi:glycine C-acetyltransferase